MHTRRTTIIFLTALLLIVLGLAFVITQSFLKPFAFAIILAIVFYPLHERILSRIRAALAALRSFPRSFYLYCSGCPALSLRYWQPTKHCLPRIT